MNRKTAIKTESNNSFAVKITKFILEWRWAICGIGLLLFIGVGVGMKKLAFRNDYEFFFNADNPQLLALHDLHNKYSDAENIFIGLAIKEGDIFRHQALSALEGLVTQLWQTPYSIRVDGLTNFQHVKAIGDELFVGDLVDNAMEKTVQELDTIRQIALNEPVLLNRFINEAGTVTGINIALHIPPDSAKAKIEISTAVRGILKDFNQEAPYFTTYLTGMSMLATSFQESSKWDISRLIPLMILIIILVLWFLLKSVSASISTFLILIFAIVSALGMAGWTETYLTVISISSITIIMTLAIADCVHILVTIVHYMQQGWTKKEAIIESLRINFLPVFITTLSTIIGFLSLNFSDTPPFRDLGNIVAMGMLGAFFGAVFLLPAIVSILPFRIKVVNKPTIKPLKHPLNQLANFVIIHHKKLLWFSCLPIIGLSLMAFQNELSDEFVKYFDKEIPFRPDTEFVSEHLTGIYNVEFSIHSGASGGISNPAYLERLESFTTWLQEQKEVVHVATYSEVMKKVNKSMHGDDEAFYTLPKSQSEAAQYLFIYEMSLPFGLDINNQLDIDKAASRLTVTLKNISSNQIIAFTERAENWLVENCPNPAMHALGVSRTLMFSHMTRQQIYSLLYGIGIALFFITLILIITFRSLGYGLLSLIPNIIPITVGFGIWSMVNGTINMGTSIVFGMVLGIIVDDTVHFMIKYLSAKKELKYTASEAVKYAFATVGKALIITTAILSLGFLVLGQSRFNINSDMAYMTVIIIVLALIVDFLMLPALLLLVGKRDIDIEMAD